jgi:hypothetical protein
MSGQQVGEHLGIAVAAEDDAIALQPDAEFKVVIDLAVETDDDLASRIGHRLRPGGRKVEDGQAHVRQAGISIMPLSTSVRATMALGMVHLSEQIRLEATDISCDPAHGQPWPPSPA